MSEKIAYYDSGPEAGIIGRQLQTVVINRRFNT